MTNPLSSTSNRTNKWPTRILGPLWDFLQEQHPEGATAKAIASRLDVSQQSVGAMFRADNTHLKKAEEVFAAYGYLLTLEYNYTGDYPELPVEIVRTDTGGNLSGLEEHRLRMGWTLNMMAAKCGVKRDTLAKAIAKGDIMLDVLSEISFILRLNITWKWTKIHKT